MIVGQQNTLIARSSCPRTTVTSTGEREGLSSWNSTVALIEFYGEEGHYYQRMLIIYTLKIIPLLCTG